MQNKVERSNDVCSLKYKEDNCRWLLYEIVSRHHLVPKWCSYCISLKNILEFLNVYINTDCLTFLHDGVKVTKNTFDKRWCIGFTCKFFAFQMIYVSWNNNYYNFLIFFTTIIYRNFLFVENIKTKILFQKHWNSCSLLF